LDAAGISQHINPLGKRIRHPHDARYSPAAFRDDNRSSILYVTNTLAQFCLQLTDPYLAFFHCSLPMSPHCSTCGYFTSLPLFWPGLKRHRRWRGSEVVADPRPFVSGSPSRKHRLLPAQAQPAIYRCAPQAFHRRMAKRFRNHRRSVAHMVRGRQGWQDRNRQSPHRTFAIITRIVSRMTTQIESAFAVARNSGAGHPGGLLSEGPSLL
jgi:hypothetical protein